MQIGFLGHNGFAVGDQSSPVLIDAILLRRYGDEYTSSPVEIYPPRTIDHAAMPTPAAVIISHEHSDHFHLPSLNKIDRAVPIVVGPTMIDSVVAFIEELGFSVQRMGFGETRQFGSTLVTLYAPGRETVLWESRVSQVYVRDAADPEIGGVFLGIDALVSEDFLNDIVDGEIPAPAVIAVSNNAQVTPRGVFGSLDNLKSPQISEHIGRRTGFAGLDILQGIVSDTLGEHPTLQTCHVLICGGGFLKDYEAMGPFPFSEQKEMAEIASRLTRWIDVVGPEPGEIVDAGPDGIDIVGKLGWLGTDTARFTELKERRRNFLSAGESIPLRQIVPASSRGEEEALFDEIEVELRYLAAGILLSDLGRDLVSAGNGGKSLIRPLVLKFRCMHTEDRSYALDLTQGGFVRVDDLSLDGALKAYPYGVYTCATDFAAVVRGDLQIWDVVGIAMHSWYESEAFSSPVAFMYDAFGEQVRPDIACRAYGLQIDAIKRGVE
ncbi:MBL fold metallo-hydrolase [Streptomyces sp. NPDC004561]